MIFPVTLNGNQTLKSRLETGLTLLNSGVGKKHLKIPSKQSTQNSPLRHRWSGSDYPSVGTCKELTFGEVYNTVLGKMERKRRKKWQAAMWMDSIIMVLAALFVDMKDQIGDRASCRKSMWSLRADTNLMAHRYHITILLLWSVATCC